MNTIINVCSKPLHQLLTQFNPISLEGFGSGDVKYHLGMHAEKLLERLGFSEHANSLRKTLILGFGRTNKKIMIAIMANPSHLEAIDPVVVGRIRAEQVEKNDAKRMHAMHYF